MHTERIYIFFPSVTEPILCLGDILPGSDQTTSADGRKLTEHEMDSMPF